MRHSTITLTADLYHDLGLEDVGALAMKLPSIQKPASAASKDNLSLNDESKKK